MFIVWFSRRTALILAVVDDKGPAYPYGISEEIVRRTGGKVELPATNVLLSLLAYEKRGWVECQDLLVYDVPKGPPIVHYTLTEIGCRVLEQLRAKGRVSVED